MRNLVVIAMLLLILALGVLPVGAIGSGEQHSSTALTTIPKMQAAVTNEGIIRSIVKAPVTPDGQPTL